MSSGSTIRTWLVVAIMGAVEAFKDQGEARWNAPLKALHHHMKSKIVSSYNKYVADRSSRSLTVGSELGGGKYRLKEMKAESMKKARGIRFEFRKSATDHTFMRMDGEPWKQPLPLEKDTVTVEISCSGQVSMLATGSYPSKSVYDPTTPRTPKDDELDSDEEDSVEDISEERKKFGAATSFRLPENFDISQVS